MVIQHVTLDVPDTLYERLRRMAEEAHRTVEDELLHVVATAVPGADELPADLNEGVSQLAVLDDAALLGAARHDEEVDKRHSGVVAAVKERFGAVCGGKLGVLRLVSFADRMRLPSAGAGAGTS